MIGQKVDDRQAIINFNMASSRTKPEIESTDKEAGKNSLTTADNAIEQVLLPIRSAVLRGNPPALIRAPGTYTFSNPKTESLSDGELSDFSLNDTEEDEEEFRNCVLLNGTQSEGKYD